MGTSAWLLSKAALHPSIAAISVAVVGVRAFGVSRATLRYLERLASHDVTLRLLARLRVAVYRALVPLAPARLAGHRSGDLLGRVIEDVAALETLYVRVVGPSVAAVGDRACSWCSCCWPFGPSAGGGGRRRPRGERNGLPLARLAAGPGPGTTPRLAARASSSARLVDGVQGQAELLAFGREADHAAAVGAVSRGSGRRTAAPRPRLRSRRRARGPRRGPDRGRRARPRDPIRPRRDDSTASTLAVVTLLTLAAFEAVATLPAAWTGMAVVRRVGSAGSSRSRTSRPRSSSPPAPARAGPRASSRCAICASPTRASLASRSTA